jgi:peptidylprolyl isomerase
MKRRSFRALVLLSALLIALPGTGAGQAVPPVPPDVAEVPADAAKTSSGLAYKVLEPGKGDRRPAKGDLVVVHYTGWTTDGKMFDSSATRGKPSTFGVDRVIPGFSEGIQLMAIGEQRRLWIPESLAYKGVEGRPKGMLVFDIQLLDIQASPTGAPPDVAKPPDDASRTSSGLAYKVIKDGTGSAHPTRSSRVTVHYTGWTTDGKVFDSSVSRGQPATFALNQVIQGWTEGLLLMVEGDKRRFWIPENLAYQGQSGKPRGVLVFDIELLKIER